MLNTKNFSLIKIVTLFLICIVIGVGIWYKDYFRDRNLPSSNLIPNETTQNTICSTNKDCWCRNFDGSKFISGSVENTCNIKTNRCSICSYD